MEAPLVYIIRVVHKIFLKISKLLVYLFGRLIINIIFGAANEIPTL